jgi:hypothetical protein
LVAADAPIAPEVPDWPVAVVTVVVEGALVPPVTVPTVDDPCDGRVDAVGALKGSHPMPVAALEVVHGAPIVPVPVVFTWLLVCP